MKQGILRNWNFIRFLRLGLGIFIIIQAVIVKDWTMGILGIIFTLMPIFNVGCCGTGGCATHPSKITPGATKDITYEEIV